MLLRLAFVLCAAWSVVGGTTAPGPDFYHYVNSTIDRVDVDGGVTRLHWQGQTEGADLDFALAYPAVTRLHIPSGVRYPAAACWLPSDVYFVAIRGTLTFEDENNASALYTYGDVKWVLAGHSFGPIRNMGLDEAWVLVVGTNFEPECSAAPSDANPSVHPTSLSTRSYFRVQGKYSPNPSQRTTECWATGGVYNMNFNSYGNTGPLLRVKWGPNCQIPYHYHPTWAMYFIQYGKMYFKGDGEGADVEFNQGEVRWVRPGFAYGPEYTRDDAMEITVLGTDTPPAFQAPPPGPYKMQKEMLVTHIFE